MIPKWMDWALELQEEQDKLFWDNDSGGYFSSHGNDKHVLVRMKEEQDMAEPSPNSVSVSPSSF